MYKMVNIYCITDCNGLKYVGSTRQTVKKRLSNHTYEKKKGKNNCSSHKLDLDNCEIEVLEECEGNNRTIREQYWIQNTDCVNTFLYKNKVEVLKVKIYCITDCNGLNYVGSTNKLLSTRLSNHRSDKKRNHTTEIKSH